MAASNVIRRMNQNKQFGLKPSSERNHQFQSGSARDWIITCERPDSQAPQSTEAAGSLPAASVLREMDDECRADRIE